MAITLWFDPGCPFTWRTSRWLKDVAGRRGESVTWRFLSLSILNEGKDVPEQFRPYLAWARRAHRVLVAADQRHGQDAVDRLYTALGERVHDGGAEREDATIAAAIEAAGLPADLVRAADDTDLDKPLRDSHDESQARVGTESGSPVVAVGTGPAFFGPVVHPIPTGAEADRLFEALSLLSTVPQFSELKRSRNPF
jgi:2-hydroxychromene-2-carboxylate isomerase